MVYEFVCVVDVRVLAAMVVGLLGFGYGFDKWVAGLVAEGRDQGYLSFIVALGVAVTLAGISVAVWSVWMGLVMAAGFASSGLFMIWGSVSRHIEQRTEEEMRARREARQELADER